jgi:hypothetical protein
MFSQVASLGAQAAGSLASSLSPSTSDVLSQLSSHLSSNDLSLSGLVFPKAFSGSPGLSLPEFNSRSNSKDEDRVVTKQENSSRSRAKVSLV